MITCADGNEGGGADGMVLLGSYSKGKEVRCDRSALSGSHLRSPASLPTIAYAREEG